MPPLYVTVPLLILDIIRETIRREGGYVDHPSDPGGATNMGITIYTLKQWRGTEVTKDDVRNLTREEATQIYYQLFWKPLNLENLSTGWLKELMFDWCVNAGARNPIRQLQRLVGTKSDGYLGPKTATLIADFYSLHGIRAPGLIVDCRIMWYLRLAQSKHSRIDFVPGWFNRANDFRYLTKPYSNR